MKKTIITILLTVCVMTGLGFYAIDKINQNHEIELSELNDKYETEMQLNAELMSEHNHLERNVYRMMNDKTYEITVEHNGETHVWKSDDNKGIFTEQLHHTIY